MIQMLKTHETVKDAKNKLKQRTKTREKKATTSENCILRKMG